MRNNNFKKSHIYQSEATLFINPSKKQKIKDKNPKIFFSFFLAVILFSSIISFSVLADNKNNWTVWHDDNYEFTYIDAWGSIATDLMTLTIKNNNCDKLLVNFFISSDRESIAKDWTKFIVEITETPHDQQGVPSREYKNVVFINYTEILQNGIVYMLGFDHEYETNDWIERLDNSDPFYFYLSIAEHAEEQADPTIYFEHTDNIWDMSDLKDTLKNAYRNCRFQNYNEISL